MIQVLDEEIEAFVNAAPYQQISERCNYRNGSYGRDPGHFDGCDRILACAATPIACFGGDQRNSRAVKMNQFGVKIRGQIVHPYYRYHLIGGIYLTFQNSIVCPILGAWQVGDDDQKTYHFRTQKIQYTYEGCMR